MQQFMNTDNLVQSCLPVSWEATVSASSAAPHFAKHEQQIQLSQFDQGSFMHMLYTMPSPALELSAAPDTLLPASTWYMPNYCTPAVIQPQSYYFEQASQASQALTYQLALNTPPSPPLSVISNEGFMPTSPLSAHISSIPSSSASSSSSPSASSNNVPNGSSDTVYHCPACTKQFTRPYNLKSHMRTHTNERPYACDHGNCPWKFARPHDLKRHQLLHSGLTPHECAHCNKGFARRDALRRHWKVDRECGEAEERSGLSSTRRCRRKKIRSSRSPK